MSAKLKKQIEVQLALLRMLLGRYPDLLVKTESDTLTAVEIAALAALLHSFYSGVENLFKRIGITLDGGVPTGEASHTLLLYRMTCSTQNRGPVISEELHTVLRKYLDFRHMFRHAYTFELQWTRMAPLAVNCGRTLDRVETEVRAFLQQLEERG